MNRLPIALSLLLAGLTVQAQQHLPNLDEMFFKQFDSDQDGHVSKAEFLAPNEAQFKHMDSDGDGSLNKAEVKTFNDEMTRRMREMQQQMQRQGGGPQGMPER